MQLQIRVDLNVASRTVETIRPDVHTHDTYCHQTIYLSHRLMRSNKSDWWTKDRDTTTRYLQLLYSYMGWLIVTKIGLTKNLQESLKFLPNMWCLQLVNKCSTWYPLHSSNKLFSNKSVNLLLHFSFFLLDLQIIGCSGSGTSVSGLRNFFGRVYICYK